MTSAASAKDFLSAILGESQGWAELTAIGKGGVQSFPFSYPDGLGSLIETAPRHNRNANIYFGICLRREKWPRSTGRKDAEGKPEMEFRGTEENVSSSWCVWTEFDFEEEGHKGRVIPQELCRKLIKEFRFAPSVVVKSGGGVQVYWLFKEAVTGEDLWRVKAVNKALVTCFTVGANGADPQSVDLARIFRIPGTLNVKYTPPRLCEISLWHPERRYTLDDFEGLLPVEAIQKQIAASPGEPSSSSGRPMPSLQLEPEKIDELGNLFNQLWFEGHRHAMALRVAGMLAFSEVRLEDAKAIVTLASDKAGGDTAKRLKDVDDTYQSFINGKEVVGAPSIAKMIEEELPDLVPKKKCHDILKKIKNLLPKRERSEEGEEKKSAKPNFDIIKVIKFDSRPARYTVVIRKHSEEKDYEVPCEIEAFTNIKRFRQAFTEASENKNIAAIKQWQWEKMYEAAPCEIRPAPEEATLGGAIRSHLETFLEDKKENAKTGELKTFAGFNENEIFFSLRALKGKLNDAKIKASDQAITQVLEQDGWTAARRWVDGKNPRLWFKSFKNGTSDGGHGGNGKQEPPKPTSPQKELFPESSQGKPEQSSRVDTQWEEADV